MSYTISDLQRDFPDEVSVLEWLVDFLYPEGIVCNRCERITKHYKDSGRRSYSCGVCGLHFHPTAGTALHKTKVPLQIWMYAMHRLTTTRNGVSAAQLQRETGMAYNTCWKLLHKIRVMMADSSEPLKDEVEVDETYIHANVFKRSSARFKYGPTGARAGQVVFGLVERGGRVKIYHVMTAGARILQPIIHRQVSKGTTIYSDGHGAYLSLPRQGYRHFSTNHSIGERVNGNNHTQNIENVWSHLKRCIKGTYKYVSPVYLQNYCNEIGFRYSNRNNPSMFWTLVSAVLLPSKRSLETLS